MKKLVNHYGPVRVEESDPIESSLQDPGVTSAERENVEYENHEAASTLRDFVSPKVAEKLEAADNVVRKVMSGIAIWKTVKAWKDKAKGIKLSRNQKIAAGALVAAGVAGAIYMRNRNKR
jgi:hypothetical protein